MKNYLLWAAIAIAMVGCNSSGNSDNGSGSRQAASLDGAEPAGGGNALTQALADVLALLQDILVNAGVDITPIADDVNAAAAALAALDDPADATAVTAAISGLALGQSSGAVLTALTGSGGLTSVFGKPSITSLVDSMDVAAAELASPTGDAKALKLIATPLMGVDQAYVASAAELLSNSSGFRETKIAALSQLAGELAIAAGAESASGQEAALSEALSVLISGLSSRLAGDQPAAAEALVSFSSMLASMLENYDFTALDAEILLQLQQSL